MFFGLSDYYFCTMDHEKDLQLEKLFHHFIIICLLYSILSTVNSYNFHGVHQYFKYVNSFFDTQVKVAPTLSQSCDYPQTKLHLPSVKIALSHSLSCNYPHSIYHQSKLHLPSVKVAPTLSQSCSYPQ